MTPIRSILQNPWSVSAGAGSVVLAALLVEHGFGFVSVGGVLMVVATFVAGAQIAIRPGRALVDRTVGIVWDQTDSISTH